MYAWPFCYHQVLKSQYQALQKLTHQSVVSNLKNKILCLNNGNGITRKILTIAKDKKKNKINTYFFKTSINENNSIQLSHQKEIAVCSLGTWTIKGIGWNYKTLESKEKTTWKAKFIQRTIHNFS